MRKIATVAVTALLMSSASVVQAQTSGSDENDLRLTSGIDFSSGDYGTGIDTDILVVPVSARFKSGNVRLTATLPYIRINGAANIVGGDGGPIIVDPNSPRVRRDGIGDLSLGVNYTVPEEILGVGLDFGARVKLPTAASGLGTDKTDFSLSVEASKTFGAVTPFAQLGYRIPGDPDGFALQNTLFGSIGFSVTAGKSIVLASYDYREATSTLADDSQEIFGAFSTPVSDALQFTLYGSLGLSDGSPDYGVGTTLTLKLF